MKRQFDMSGRRLGAVLLCASVRSACSPFHLALCAASWSAAMLVPGAGPAGHQAVLRGGGAGGVEVRHPVRSLRHPHHHPGVPPAQAQQRRRASLPGKLIAGRTAAVVSAGLTRVCSPDQPICLDVWQLSLPSAKQRPIPIASLHGRLHQVVHLSSLLVRAGGEGVGRGGPCRPSSSATPSEKWTGSRRRCDRTTSRCRPCTATCPRRSATPSWANSGAPRGRPTPPPPVQAASASQEMHTIGGESFCLQICYLPAPLRCCRGRAAGSMV